MRCVKCDSRIGRKAKFCAQCGTDAPAREPNGAAAEAKDFAKDVFIEGTTVAKEAAQLAKEGIKSDVGKSVAACAALGAVIAVPIPFFGPLLGAAVGAGVGLIRKI
jgi:hypothetical protein